MPNHAQQPQNTTRMNQLLPSDRIKAEARRLGFAACGLAPAAPVAAPVAGHFRRWLHDGKQGGMGYLANHVEMRIDPRLLLERAQTVICVALNYYPPVKLPPDSYQIACYAYGKDYHEVMRNKLRTLLAFAQEAAAAAAPASCRPAEEESGNGLPPAAAQSTEKPAANGRICCDTAPLLERYWAWRAGLGWIGKNTQLIVPGAGAYFFLGEVLMDIPADRWDNPMPDRCGRCRHCIDACPAHAIEAPYNLCAARCLSYLTIEHRGELPPSTGLKMGRTIYGCDECLHACPWNRFAKPTDCMELHPSETLLHMTKEDWQQLTEEKYRLLFKGSAVKRAKYQGLTRNIQAVADAESRHKPLDSEEKSD